MHIRDYLCRVAAEMSDNALAGIDTLDKWESERERRYEQYLQMIGLDHHLTNPERTPLNVVVTEVIERPDVRIEKLYFEALPKVYITGNLYIPQNPEGAAPGVVYVCGHSLDQKTHYQPHPRRWAQLGFVTLLLETVQRSEIEGWHHGCYTYGHWQWYSQGYTPGGIEAWAAIRGADLLQARDEVISDRIGITGISGGGATSYWAGAADERFKVVAPVCGTGTIRSHIRDRTWDGHCDCMSYINTYGIDLADVGALIAPRPLMVASANRDGIYSIASIRETFHRTKRVYDLHGADARLIETPGGHSYHRDSRTGIFSFFMKHLMEKDVSPEEIEDVGGEDESTETLKVYVKGIPKDERVSKVQEFFLPVAAAPTIKTADDTKKERDRLVWLLREQTFEQFPKTPCDLNVETHFEYQNGDNKVARVAFTSEPDWRCIAAVHRDVPSQDKDSPALVYLRNQNDTRWEFESFVNGFDPTWVRVGVACRGVGELAWASSLQWHVRRNAALAGRTIASMQVYDALRALEFVRGLPEVNERRIAIAGKGQMAVVALYAALLDGNLEAVILRDPPATQNAPSEPDGTGDAIEMLNVLRHTDLPYAAGLLFPSDVVFVGEKPKTYDWTTTCFKTLGGRLVEAAQLREYQPKSS